ncbi:MAG: DUF2304 domain-containing protein [Planctomycetes bacterium]|nr:DUF2304 domain-containing protein [Planctomycetota bacterium]
MTGALRVILMLAGLGLLGVVLTLIRRRRLDPGDAALWLATGAAVLVFAAVPGALGKAAGWLGIDVTMLLVLVVLALVGAIVVRRSVTIARHTNVENDLAREVAALEEQVGRLREELRAQPPPQAEQRPRPPSLRT